MAGFYVLGFLLSTIGHGADGADPAELVTRLGSPRFAVREKAGAALVKLGKKALPTLSSARASRDPEIRGRAEILLERIEANAILEATPIRLNLKDSPLEEAVRAIESESGMALRYDGAGRGPRGEPSWPDRRLSVVTNGPVPFWEAVDRLCEGGGVQRPYPPAEGTFVPNHPPFELTLLPGTARPPVSDHGPFRVELLRIRDDRMRDYGSLESTPPSYRRPFGPRSNPTSGPLLQSFFRAELLVSTEPRLRIIGVGAVEKTEAIDDFGRSLLKTSSHEERPFDPRLTNSHIDPGLYPSLRYGQSQQDSKRSWVLSVPFVDLASPGRRIAKLSGVVPVAVLARRSNPLIVPLDDAKGKTFVSGSTHLTIHEVAVNSKSGVAVNLTLEGQEDAIGPMIRVREVGGNTLAINAPTDLLELRLELVDDRGEPVESHFTEFSTNGLQRRVTIRAQNRDPGSDRPDPLRLRCWGVIGAAVDIPFTFRNIQMPRSRLGTPLRTGIEGSHP